MGDPVLIRFQGTQLSLRGKEAASIMVTEKCVFGAYKWQAVVPRFRQYLKQINKAG